MDCPLRMRSCSVAKHGLSKTFQTSVCRNVFRRLCFALALRTQRARYGSRFALTQENIVCRKAFQRRCSTSDFQTLRARYRSRFALPQHRIFCRKLGFRAKLSNASAPRSFYECSEHGTDRALRLRLWSVIKDGLSQIFLTLVCRKAFQRLCSAFLFRTQRAVGPSSSLALIHCKITTT